MKFIVTLALLLIISSSIKFNWIPRGEQEVKATVLSQYYCGFGDNFCGQSKDDDVNPGTKLVMLAFVNTKPDGSVVMDE